MVSLKGGWCNFSEMVTAWGDTQGGVHQSQGGVHQSQGGVCTKVKGGVCQGGGSATGGYPERGGIWTGGLHTYPAKVCRVAYPAEALPGNEAPAYPAELCRVAATDVPAEILTWLAPRWLPLCYPAQYKPLHSRKPLNSRKIEKKKTARKSTARLPGRDPRALP